MPKWNIPTDERHSFLSLYGNTFYRISIPLYCEIERQEARSVTFSRARGTEDSGNIVN